MSSVEASSRGLKWQEPTVVGTSVHGVVVVGRVEVAVGNEVLAAHLGGLVKHWLFNERHFE